MGFASSTHGSQQTNVASAATLYPTNGETGATTTTAANSILVDANKVIVDRVVVLPTGVTGTGQLIIEKHDGTDLITIQGVDGAAEMPTYVEIGLEVNSGIRFTLDDAAKFTYVVLWRDFSDS